MDYLYIAAVFAVFVASALLIEGLYSLWKSRYSQEAKRLARRLDRMADAGQPAAAEVSIQKKRNFSDNPALDRLLQQMAAVQVIDTLLVQAGLQMNVTSFVLLCLGLAGGTLAVLLFTPVPVLLAVVTALSVAIIPLIMALGRKRKRLAKLEEQLPEALDLMCRALRAGHALPSAIKMVCEEMPDPLASEFRIVFNEVNYGVPMQEALRNLAARIPGSDVAFFVVAVLIQRETGGNLTELLDSISRIIRERLKLFGQIKVFTAEGRLSAWILGLLPFGLGLVMHLVNPGFMSTLWTDPAGIKMLIGVAVLMVVGAIWMRRLIRIRV